MTSFQRWVAARTEHELIATFGEAKLVRDMSGRLELKDGSEEDRQQVRLWARMFLTRADHQRPPVVSERYPGHALGHDTPIGH